MIDDVILNKVATIERCLKRIDEEFVGFESQFETNYTKQDSILLNLQRACEASIDLGAYLIRINKLGVPQSSRDIFVLLQKASIIDASLSKRLQAMVGFRNIAIHEYRELDLNIVTAIITKQKNDFLEFTKIALSN